MVTLKQHISRQKLSSYLGGDSSTPLGLVQEMVDKIPQEVKKNPNSKFLDPAAGVGTFVIVLFYELKKYHSEEHILNNMLYVCEVNRFKLRILKKLGIKNIYEGSFLEQDFKDMKFDVIIGNPPYQQQHGAKRWTLWSKFIEKANELSPKYLAYVIPNSWLGPNKEHDLIFQNLEYASLDVSKYFNVGSTFSYIICSNSPKETVSIFNGAETISIPRTLKFLPNDTRFISINSKFFNRPTFGFVRTNEHHTTYKGDWGSEEGEFEIFHSHAQSFKSHKRPLRYSYEGYKAIITLSGYSNFLIKNNIGTSQIGAWMELNEYEISSAESILNSKLYQKMLQVNKWSGWNSLHVIKSLPSMPLTHVYTDSEIYSYFNLTQGEIKLIEGK